MSSSVPSLSSVDLSGHVALVTGANHGIGAAVARRLAACGASVLITYLRIGDAPDPGVPEEYRRKRARDADDVMPTIAGAGGTAVALEADLAAEGTPTLLFDAAEEAFDRDGPPSDVSADVVAPAAYASRGSPSVAAVPGRARRRARARSVDPLRPT